MMEKKRALLIELGEGHSELFYTHFKLLDNLGYNLSFLGVKNYEKVQGEYFSLFEEVILEKKNHLNQLLFYFRVRKWVKKNKIELIILNTASGSSLLKLIYVLPKHILKIGVAHTINRYAQSGSQKLLRRRVKKFLFLSESVCSVAPEFSGISKSYIYPVYFKFDRSKVELSKDVLRVAIPGNINRARRDYESFVDFLSKNKDNLQGKCVFYILGNASIGDGQWLIEKSREKKIHEMLHLYESFISIKPYYTILQECHCVMPLITQSTKYYKLYMNSRISGSFNLAYGFSKPMLMDNIFVDCKEFKDTSLFYESEAALLSMLVGDSIRNFVYPKDRFDVEVQTKRLRNLIGNPI